jgi:hypothetical protein
LFRESERRGLRSGLLCGRASDDEQHVFAAAVGFLAAPTLDRDTVVAGRDVAALNADVPAGIDIDIDIDAVAVSDGAADRR